MKCTVPLGIGQCLTHFDNIHQCRVKLVYIYMQDRIATEQVIVIVGNFVKSSRGPQN